MDLRHWHTPGFVLILLGIAALGLSDLTAKNEWWVPALLIITSGLALLPSIRRALRGHRHEILADHLLVLACAFLAYYVFGALLIPLGPHDQADYSLSYYWVDAVLAMRATAVNNIGFGIALVFGSLIGQNSLCRIARTAITLGRSIPQRWVIVAFLFVGGASSMYVLAFDTGLRDGVAPGLLRTMSKLLLVAIIVAAAHRDRGAAWLLLVAVGLTVLQALGGLLLFNKSMVLEPLVALLIGLAWRLGVRRVMVPGLAAVLVVFILIGNPVSTARSIYGLSDQVDWNDRTRVMWEGVLHPSQSIQGGDYPAWARFSYLPSQGAAIDLYDSGQGGDDFGLLGWAFLPRFLFPEKPILTATGTDFHFKVTGATGSSTGHGVFVNGYYNLGWWGVIFVGITVGCILSSTSAFATQVFRARALLWLPMALLGSYMAFRIDGTFLADYWGTFILFGYAVLGSVALKGLLRPASQG